METLKRICLITGASGVLGTSFIEHFAHRYKIIAVYKQNAIQYATQDQSFVDPLAPEQPVSANGHAVYSFKADISHQDEIKRLIYEITNQFGHIDLLINMAATYARSHLLAPGALIQAETLMKVNVLAPLRFSVELAQNLWRSDLDANLRYNRNIINVSSTSGLYVHPDLGLALYATSKAALNHLTYYLASEFWDIGIRVNAIAPGTFYNQVSIDNVLDAIIDLDNSDLTGKVITFNTKV